MAIFKKFQLDGNAVMGTGKSLEFKDNYYETEDECELALLRSMACYTEVEARDSDAPAQAQAPAKATVGQISTAAIINAK